jgi:hypothetical protein
LPEVLAESNPNKKIANMLFRLVSSALLVGMIYGKTPDNVSSRLMVQIPRKLYKEEGYDHREALFGAPPYGGSIAQNVYYADSDLCDPTVDTTKGYPQRENNVPWIAPYILMVDRGGCTFVKKVRNAQRSGAAGVIIADNTCLCDDTDCMTANNSMTCETSEPIMADDGSGSDISIPSFLMFKRDADAIKDVLLTNSPVQLEMSWSLPKPDDRVEYDLWSVPTEIRDRSFLKEFKPIAKALGDRAYFTPHTYIFDGERTHCRGNDGANQCFNLCTNNGRYCATDPDNDLDKGISGQDVVKESLRRLCIWKTYGDQDGIGEKWWTYVEQFLERCATSDYFKNEDCIRDCYKHSGVDEETINYCMENSGGLTADRVNSFLEVEIAAQQERGVVVLPTAFVNTAAIRGKLSVSTIFSAICAGYADGTRPLVCDQCASCGDPVACVTSKSRTCAGSASSNSGSSSGVSYHFFVMTLFFISGGFVGLLLWNHKKTKEDMRDQVRGILAEYMPLEDQEADTPGVSPMDFARRGGTVSLIS